jgi:exopolysaccharide biosynthesis WecB/TagA/CpsF family protein
MDRVYGPDLMLELCAASTDGSVQHFLYGGGPGVAEALRSSLESRFPGLCVCGTDSPPFRPLNHEEEADLVRQMESLRPDIFWIGLSTPKQERFIAYLDKLTVRIMIGVGAAFDMHSGRVRQAPYWMQRSGLEWPFPADSGARTVMETLLDQQPSFRGSHSGSIHRTKALFCSRLNPRSEEQITQIPRTTAAEEISAKSRENENRRISSCCRRFHRRASCQHSTCGSFENIRAAIRNR